VTKESTAIQLIGAVARRPKVSNVLFGWHKWGNPFGEDRYVWPYPSFERIRVDGPVVYSRLYRQWFVLGFDEVQAVLCSPNASTTKAGQVLLDLPAYRKLTPQVRADVTRWLLVQDPPDHTRLRAAVARAFTPRATKRHQDTVSQVTNDLIDALPKLGEVDLVERFTARLPIQVIASLLGLPTQRWEWLRRMSQSLGSVLEALSGIDPVTINRDVAELHEFFRSVVADRRAHPQDDLISALTADDGEARLDDDEVIAMIGFLLFAGHETVTGALGNAIVALSRYPDQQQLLLENPDLIDNAVEELLRFDTSAVMSARTSTGPIEINGITIPPNAVVGLFIGAANHDPRRWDEPSALRLDRTNPRGVTFGYGIHHCLGASLARLQMRTAIPQIVRRIADGQINTAGIEWKRSTTLRGPTRIPLHL
jgi:cytochrome P450